MPDDRVRDADCAAIARGVAVGALVGGVALALDSVVIRPVVHGSPPRVDERSAHVAIVAGLAATLIVAVEERRRRRV